MRDVAAQSQVAEPATEKPTMRFRCGENPGHPAVEPEAGKSGLAQRAADRVQGQVRAASVGQFEHRLADASQPTTMGDDRREPLVPGTSGARSVRQMPHQIGGRRIGVPQRHPRQQCSQGGAFGRRQFLGERRRDRVDRVVPIATTDQP